MYNLAIYNLRLKSHLELIDTVDVRFHRCRDNIRIGTEPIINMIIVFHLHMYLTHIVATLADSLDSEFLQCHMAVNNLLQSLDSSVYRTPLVT